MWKLPSTTDNPPPYSVNPSDHAEENEQRETTSKIIINNQFTKKQLKYFCIGLLAAPSAPNDLMGETHQGPRVLMLVRRSNDTLDSEELLDAGTPPPSYAEVLACISTPAVNELDDDVTITGILTSIFITVF